MARLRLPFPPAWLFMRTRFDNRARVADLAVPLLVMHGDRDTLIPISQGRAVFEAAPEPKQFHVIRGAGHNDTYLAGGREYFGVLARFCRDCVGVPSGGRPDG
ncbi:MAG: hypothetical protein AMK73_09565 [Planctomycetes bacterium SM23_32]|nr:MAG: hypothetical protein AMK73_09565 [Planctomycetes bacterium SM23_32]